MTKFCKTAAAILIAAMALSAVFVGGATVRASAAEPSDAFYLNKIAEFSTGMSDADGGCGSVTAGGTGYMMIGLSVVIAVAFAVMLAARRRGKDK